MGRIPSIGGIADAGALENSYIELFKARDARAARLWEYAEILYSAGKLTVDDVAGFINDVLPCIDKIAYDFDRALFSVDFIAKVLDSANLSADKLQAILDDANLSIQRGQEIVDAMSNPEKIGIGGRRSYLGDDWEDNKLTNRDKAATVATSLDKIFQVFRPEWSGAISNASVSEGVVTITASNAEIYVNYGRNIGTKLHAICYCADRGTNDWHIAQFRFIRVDENNFYYVGPGADGTTWRKRFGKVVNGTHTELWNPTTGSSNTGTWEVKGDGNGKYEVFLNGVSQVTKTDTDITENYGVGLASAGNKSNGVKFDNLEIKPL